MRNTIVFARIYSVGAHRYLVLRHPFRGDAVPDTVAEEGEIDFFGSK
jgi:hypothetical protein